MTNNKPKRQVVVSTGALRPADIDLIINQDWLRVRGKGDYRLHGVETKRVIARKMIVSALLENSNQPMHPADIAAHLQLDKRQATVITSYISDLFHVGVLNKQPTESRVGTKYFLSKDTARLCTGVKPLDIDSIKNLLSNNAFCRNSYSVSVPVSTAIQSLLSYMNNAEPKDDIDIFNAVPSFQRDNDKWSELMQIKFIENVLKGYKSTIMLYEIVPAGDTPTLVNCLILDGLQRITALYRFINGEIKAFNKSYGELVAGKVLSSTRRVLEMKIYSFASEREAINFYIEMNENITHSPMDIAKARGRLVSLPA